MLSEVPEGWQLGALENVCEILDKFRVPLNSEERMKRSGTVPYWGANGIVDYIDDYIFNEPLLLMPEDGGPFSESSSKPICHKVDGPTWVNNHAHVLKVKDANREYIYQWFVNRDITDYLVGGTRAKLNQKALRKLPVLLPPLTEQKRIAEVLSSVDESIQATQRLIEQAERVKQGLMEELLTGGLGSEAIERGEVPEGWLSSTFGDEIEFKGGNQPPKKTFIYEPKDGYVRLLQIRDVENDLKPAYIPETATKVRCNEQDILIARYGASLGRICRGKAGAYNVALVKLLLSERLVADYAFYWLNGDTFQSYLISVGSRSAQAGFNKQDLAPLVLLLPPLTEQKRIAEVLSSVDDRVKRHKDELEELSRLKKGLMDDLLTGKVRTV